MNDIFRRKITPGRADSTACGASSHTKAGFFQFFPSGGSKDRSADSASCGKIFIGGIDDGIGFDAGDIFSDHVEGHGVLLSSEGSFSLYHIPSPAASKLELPEFLLYNRIERT